MTNTSHLKKNSQNQAVLMGSHDQDGPIVTADQVVSILLGSSSVTLHGFGGKPANASFWVPQISRPEVALSNAVYKKTSRQMHKVFVVAVCVALLCLGGLVFWVGTFLQKDLGVAKNSAVATIAWTASAVVSDGVSVVIGSETLTVKLGAMLPNGEILRAIDPKRQTFATDSQITAIKK